MNTDGFSGIHARYPCDVTTLLVGGFGLPPQVLARLARELDARVAPTGLTIGCGEAEAQKVVHAIDEHDEPVTLVGHSRGGQLAHVAAARRPDKVRAVVTVGTPATIGPPTRWGVPAMASVLRRLPFDLALDCATAACCEQFRADLLAPLAMRWTAIVSPIDRIVPLQDALVDGADERVEVRASHVGLVTSARGRAAIRRAASR
jgi:pimeloyl-ACP methyl ester carboxylesterase